MKRLYEITPVARQMLLMGSTIFILSVILYLFYTVMRPFLVIILTSLAISVFLYPFYNFVTRKLNGRKSLSALICLTGLLVIIIIPIGFFVHALFQELKVAVVLTQERVGLLAQVERIILETSAMYGIPISEADIDLRGRVIDILKYLSEQSGRIITQTGSLLISTILTLLTTFYLLTERDRLFDYLEDAVPMEKEYYRKLLNKAIEVIDATLRGNLLIIFIQTLVAILGFALFGMHSPILLGFIFGMLAVLPTVGAALVWVPSVIYLVLTGHPLAGIGLMIWLLGSGFILDSYIAPRFIGSRIKLHPILVIFSVLGGLQAFGLIGIILGPTILAMAFVVLEIYKEMLTSSSGSG